MNWITYCILTIILYGIHDIILNHLSDTNHATVASIIINLSAGIGLLLFFSLSFVFNKEKVLPKTDPTHFFLLIIAGLALGTATITFMKAFGSGGNFSIALPFVYVGIIVLSVIVGYFFYKESISMKQLIGIALSLIGMVLLYQK